MELKVNLLTIILVVALIIIVCMGIHIYNITEENNIRISEETTINTENLNNENSVANKENIENANLEKLAKNKISKYLKLSVYERSNMGPMPNLLAELGLETTENLEELCENINNTSEYIKSNTKYSDFKDALLEYVTEEYFEIYYSQYKNIDGYVAFCNCAGGFVAIEVEKVILLSKVEDECIFDVTFKDIELYSHYLDGENILEGEYLFNTNIKMKIINNELFISKFLNNEVILEGSYIINNSDVSYDFYKDGTVIYSTNMTELKGTYITNGENNVKIIFTEQTIWDDDMSGKTTTEKINRIENVEIIDEEKIVIESKDNNYRGEFVKVTTNAN